MTVPLWVEELAGLFWKEAGTHEPFPRTLRQALLGTSFDVTVEERAQLSVGRVERYLARLGQDWSGGPDRPLRGCLVAFEGAGFLFLDALDPPAQRTYTLAHELAHFLRHYWQPRQRAVETYGQQILEVFDGRRELDPRERLQALVRRVPIGTHVHLMRRDRALRLPEVDGVEREADRLALELLAPAREVRSRLVDPDAEAVTHLLRRAFGLPVEMAEEYADLLYPRPRASPLLTRARKALEARRDSTASRERDTGGSRDEQQP